MLMVGIVGLLILLTLLTAAVLLIVFSKRKGLSYPACGNCGYDVSASVGSVIRCPECGLDFIEAGITAPGSKRNPLMLAGGIVLLLLVTGCIGSLFIGQVSRSQSQTIIIPAQPTAPTQAGTGQSTPLNSGYQGEDEAGQNESD